MKKLKQTINDEMKKRLPRVLIIGDSISKGYAPIVKKMLSDMVEIVYPLENCQHTGFGLKQTNK